MDMMRDPEFLDDAKRRKLEIGPMSGEEVQQLIDRVLQVSPALVTAAKGPTTDRSS